MPGPVYYDIPTDIRSKWGARIEPASGEAVYRLINMRTTKPKSYEEQRIIVLVVDENNIPLANIPVVFSYSTARSFEVPMRMNWSIPATRGDVVLTQGSGQIEHIQGSPIKDGEPGGITVFLLQPDIASDVVYGMGMLADHTGVHLTFQLQRDGVKSIAARLDDIEARLAILEFSR